MLILSAEDFKSEGQDLSMGDPVPFGLERHCACDTFMWRNGEDG